MGEEIESGSFHIHVSLVSWHEDQKNHDLADILWEAYQLSRLEIYQVSRLEIYRIDLEFNN